MTDLLTTLLSVAAVWSVAVLTPGPNFFVTVHIALAQSRAFALLTVLGIISGTALWGLAGFFGVTLLFAAAPWLFLTIKLLGAFICFISAFNCSPPAAR